MTNITDTYADPRLRLECSPDEKTLVAAFPSGRERDIVTATTNPVTGGIGFAGYGDKAGVASAYHVEKFRSSAAMSDSDVINAALYRIESDGVIGSRLIFEGGRTYTYTSSGLLRTINCLDIDLNGARLKRANADETASTLAAQAAATWPSGGTIILNTIPNNWKVGDYLAAVIDNTYAGTSANAMIIGINYETKTVTLNASMGLSGYATYPPGTIIAKSFSCFSGMPSNTDSVSVAGSNRRVRIHGGEIDGNRANQISNSWRFSNEIVLHTEGGAIYDMWIHDTKGECIVGHGFDIGGGGRCTFTDLDGSAVHMSCNDETASINQGAIIRGNIFKRTNLATTAVTGHSEGAITFSWGPGDLTIVGNHFDGGSEAIFGNFGVSTGNNSSKMLVITGNKCKDYRKVFSNAEANTYGVTVSGNTFQNCGDSSVEYAKLVSSARNVISSNACTGTTVFDEASSVPTVVGGTSPGTGTYTTQKLKYTKIGSRIFFDCEVAWQSHSGTGTLRITGLPSAAKNTTSCAVAYSSVLAGTGKEIGCMVIENTSTLYLYQCDQAGGNLNQLPMDAAGSVYISGNYQPV